VTNVTAEQILASKRQVEQRNISDRTATVIRKGLLRNTGQGVPLKLTCSALGTLNIF
jgi:hypothetical protein